MSTTGTATRSLRLGIDLDGCVYDFVDSLRRAISRRTGIPAHQLRDACCWEFYSHCWGMSTAQFLDHFAHGVDAGVIFASGAPAPGAVEVLARLRSDGHTLHVVTDRASVGTPGVAQAATAAWLRRHHITVDSLTFSPDKTSVPTDLFVDDRVENYRALLGTSTVPVLFDQPWNRQLAGATRASGWEQFYEIVTVHAAA